MSNLTDAMIRSAKPRDRCYGLNARGTPLMRPTDIAKTMNIGRALVYRALAA
jgi:hypothetical protein